MSLRVVMGRPPALGIESQRAGSGARCVSRFNGMWAFAIWDRQLRRLFISRDRFGEKPFYYVIRGGAFNGWDPVWANPAWRYRYEPGTYSHALGFRCAADAK